MTKKKQEPALGEEESYVGVTGVPTRGRRMTLRWKWEAVLLGLRSLPPETVAREAGITVTALGRRYDAFLEALAKSLNSRPKDDRDYRIAQLQAKLFATASVRLSNRIERGTLPTKAKTETWPSQKATVVSAEQALMKNASGCGVDFVARTNHALNADHCNAVQIAPDTADLAERLTEVNLRMPKRMRQRYDHILGPALLLAHAVGNIGKAAGQTVLVAQPLEHPPSRAPSLLRQSPTRLENPIDHLEEPVGLRPHQKLRATIPNRHRVLQDP